MKLYHPKTVNIRSFCQKKQSFTWIFKHLETKRSICWKFRSHDYSLEWSYTFGEWSHVYSANDSFLWTEIINFQSCFMTHDQILKQDRVLFMIVYFSWSSTLARSYTFHELFLRRATYISPDPPTTKIFCPFIIARWLYLFEWRSPTLLHPDPL